MNQVRWGPRVDAPMESRGPVAEKPAAPRPRCIHLFPIRYRGRRLVAMSRATTSPYHRLTRRPTVTSAKFFGNEPMKTLEPLSSASAERATSQTGEQGLLRTTRPRRALEAYLMR